PDRVAHRGPARAVLLADERPRAAGHGRPARLRPGGAGGSLAARRRRPGRPRIRGGAPRDPVGPRRLPRRTPARDPALLGATPAPRPDGGAGGELHLLRNACRSGPRGDVRHLRTAPAAGHPLIL